MTATAHVSLTELDGLLARIEAGETTKDDANLLRAIIQQLQGQIKALIDILDNEPASVI